MNRLTSEVRTSHGATPLKRSGLFLAACLAAIVLVVPAAVADGSIGVLAAYTRSHQLGVRLGAWSNLGGTPDDSVSVSSLSYYLTDFNEANFYFEGFFAYRFSSALMAEFSVGVVSRGDVTLHDEAYDDSYYGSMLVYPILLKLKFYPLGPVGGKFYPYLQLGGGLYYGKHNIQIVSSSSVFYYSFDEDSETTVNYVLGGGLDWPVARKFGLEFNMQYMPIDFSRELIGTCDYSSFTVAIGANYLFSPKE